jgi:hypothetical protein
MERNDNGLTERLECFERKRDSGLAQLTLSINRMHEQRRILAERWRMATSTPWRRSRIQWLSPGYTVEPGAKPLPPEGPLGTLRIPAGNA